MKNEKRRNRVFLLFGIIISLILVVSGYLIYESRRIQRLTKISISFEQELNKTLLESGIKSEQIIAVFQTKKEKDALRWIKFTKKLEIQSTRAFYLLKKIKETATENNLKVYKSIRTKDAAELEIGIRGAVLSHIIFEFKKPKNLLAIIVDDLGYHRNVSGFLNLGIPLTYAILPGLPHSTYLANKFKREGIPFILHMPMEPKGYPDINPGVGALFTKMDKEEISSSLAKALKTVPFATGLNNHMGSRFTSDAYSMRNLLQKVKEKGLFYIDSATSVNSQGFKIASELGILSARNNFFIDNKDDKDFILGRLKRLKEFASRRKKTIAISHIRTNTHLALKEYIDEMKEAGIKFVSISDILELESQ